MAREVAPRRLEAVLVELSYPVLRPDAAAALRDVTLALPEGERNLGELVSETRDDSYGSVEELAAELEETLPGEVTVGPSDEEDRAV